MNSDSGVSGKGLRDMVRTIFQLAFLFITGLIIYLSLVPRLSLPEVSYSDKVGHLLAYFVLQLSGGIGFGRATSVRIVLVFSIFLGLGLEMAQLYVPGREASIADMIANLGGIALAVAILPVANRYANLKAPKG